MSDIFLFGASGFLGGNISKRSVYRSQIIPINIRKKNWKSQLRDHPGALINCIGKAHDHAGTATEMDYFKANVEITRELFQFFMQSRASLFVHISSIAAVEEIEREEIIDENTKCRPESFYGKSKLEADQFLLNQYLPPDKKLVILRPVMIHGEGDKGNLTQLYEWVSKGFPYPLGAFESSRSLVSVDNVVYIIDEILKQRHKVSSGVYIIADDSPIEINRIIKIIGESVDKNPKILTVPTPAIVFMAKIGNYLKLPLNTKRLKKLTSNLVVSNQKIKTVLKIENLPLSAEEGLIKTVKSFKSKS